MKRRTIQTILATLALIAMAAAVKAEPDATQALRLTVELRDGSRIIGEPAVIVIPLHTVFGKIEMPLARVVSIAFDDDNERVTVIMRNSDRISGMHGLEHLEVVTLFGEVTIDTVHLRNVRVFDTESGPLREGLVLWNRLSSEMDVKHSVVGPGGTLNAGRFVEGRFGKGIELNMQEQFGVSFPMEVLQAEAGCIEFWAKLVGFPANITQGYHPSLIRSDNPDGSGFHLFFAPNNGASGGGLCINSSLGWAGTGRYGSWRYTDALKSDKAEDWHHYAIVWSDVGSIPNVTDATRKIVAFVDGQLNTTTGGRSPGRRQLFTPDNATRFGFIGYPTAAIPGASIVFDNLKIWNYAKTDFSDRWDDSLTQ